MPNYNIIHNGSRNPSHKKKHTNVLVMLYVELLGFLNYTQQSYTKFEFDRIILTCLELTIRAIHPSWTYKTWDKKKIIEQIRYCEMIYLIISLFEWSSAFSMMFLLVVMTAGGHRRSLLFLGFGTLSL